MPNIEPPDYPGPAELVIWYQTVDLLLSASVDLQPCDATVLAGYCVTSHAANSVLMMSKWPKCWRYWLEFGANF